MEIEIEIGHFSERVAIPLVDLHSVTVVPTSMSSRNSRSHHHQQQQQQQYNNQPITASTRTGMQTVRPSALPAAIMNAPDASGDTMSTLATTNSDSHPLQPRQLLDVETGRSIVVAQPAPTLHNYHQHQGQHMVVAGTVGCPLKTS